MTAAAIPESATPVERRPGLVARAWHMWSRLVFGALPTAIAVVMLALVLREALNDPIEVSPLSVPASFLAQGLTPDVMAARLLDAIDGTALQTLSETLHRPAAELENATPDLNLPIVGLSLHALASLTRKLLGWHERRLTGEVTETGDMLHLRLRLSGQGAIGDVSVPVRDGADRLLTLAAPLVWRVVSPRLYAWHVALLDAEEAEIRERLVALRRRARDAELQATLNYLIGRSLIRSGEPEEGLAAMDALVAERPGYASGHYGRAQALLALKRPQEALAAHQQGLSLDPESAWAHLVSAALLRQAGDYDAALAAARRAQELDDDDRPGLVEESHVLRAMARHADAAAHARRALALDPNHAPALVALGEALLRLDEAEAALAVFDQALREAPHLTQARHGRAAAAAALARSAPPAVTPPPAAAPPPG
jgi:tetratricopeptide (TPR) repeat protein